jgi:hypothetical protein
MNVKVYSEPLPFKVKIYTDNPDGVSVIKPKPLNVSFALTKDGKDGKDGVYFLEKISAESIPSFTPIAIINNLAYKLDASNLQHQFAFVGFATNGTLIGETCKIQQIGELVLQGWGLRPNSQYLAGTNGTLILQNISNSNFTKIVGYATSVNSLQIIKDFNTILKQ